jgi:predicted outer membrane protein
MKVKSLHFDCPAGGRGWHERYTRSIGKGRNKVKNTVDWKRLRHIVLGTAALTGGAWFLGASPSWVVASEAGSVGGEPLPKERRQNESGANSRRVDRAEDMIALLHEGNRMAIEGAKLALEKGQAERVKNYALLLTKEHQRCDKQLMDYADQKQFDHRSLEDGKQEATDGPLERLRIRQPQNFDRAFILAMVREHGKMIDSLTSTMQESRDPDLRRLLAGQLPVLVRLKKAGEAILARLPANSEN